MHDDALSTEELRAFEALLQRDPEVLALYCSITESLGPLKFPGSTMSISCAPGDLSDTAMDRAVWKLLLREEQLAPTIEMETPVVLDKQEDKQPKNLPSKPSKVRTFYLRTAILSLAALVLLLLSAQISIWLRPQHVATFADCLDAEVAGATTPIRAGDHLFNRMGPCKLDRGLVKIDFNFGAEVVVEAPAEFEMLNANAMTLYGGQVMVTVPEQAVGFTVRTPAGRVVDLGTQFGLDVNRKGIMSAHMFTGKASLQANQAKRGAGHTLTTGQARRLDTDGQLTPIPLAERKFVRDFSGKRGALWRGGNLDVADIIGSGDGFGSGYSHYGIDAKSQSYQAFPDTSRTGPVSNRYWQFKSHPFIDGLFVPDGRGQVISSQQHNFADCPDTDGLYNTFRGIFNSPRDLRLDGVDYSSKANPSVFMHTNQGITFDLDAIRLALPDSVGITGFRSLFGIADNAPYPGEADIYVLIDGQMRFKRHAVRQNNTLELDISVDDTDRFFTLVTLTNKTKVFPPGVKHILNHGDWSMFARPEFVLRQSH